MDIVYACERLIELKKSQCELLKTKIKKLENKGRRPPKDQSEVKDVKSELDNKKVELEELHNLRFDIINNC
jgi:hypothetical protein